MPDTPQTQNESSRSPLRLMAELLKDPELTPEDKQLLYEFMKTRFWHRRVMAYVALVGILAFSAFAVYSPWLPPTVVCEGMTAAATCPSPAAPDVTWVNTTLAAIVVAYYGASAARPGS